jgi:hypothetical protein
MLPVCRAYIRAFIVGPNQIFRIFLLPKCFQEPVTTYPYTKYAIEGDDLLPRPRFSTRRYDALLVCVDTQQPSSGHKGVQHPLRLIEKVTATPHSRFMVPTSAIDLGIGSQGLADTFMALYA